LLCVCGNQARNKFYSWRILSSVNSSLGDNTQRERDRNLSSGRVKTIGVLTYKTSVRFFVDLEFREVYILMVFKNGRYYEGAKGRLEAG
jgi:hypothetical protein